MTNPNNEILQIANSAKKLTGDVAKQVMQAWFGQFPLEQSFRSKYRKYMYDDDSEAQRRAYIRRGSVIVEWRARSGGRSWSEWRARSTPIIDEAITRIESAATEAGTAVPKIVARYRADLQHGRERKISQDNRTKGMSLSIKDFASKHYDEYFKVARGGKIDQELADRLNKEQKELGEFYGEFVFAAGRAVPTDDAFVSVDKPPFLPMYTSISYFWIEKIDGVEYAFLFDRHEKGKMSIQINTIGHGTLTGLIGDTGVIDYGLLDKPKKPSLIADLVRMEISDLPAGAVLFGLWCRITKGFGIKWWMIRKHDETLARLVKSLVDAKKIEAEAVEDRMIMVRCLS